MLDHVNIAFASKHFNIVVSIFGSAPKYLLALVQSLNRSYKGEHSWLKSVFVWRYVVLDEGQMIKNHESEASRSLQGLKAEYRLILSGTPLQNDLEELWAFFHFLYPEVFVDKTRDLFAKGFNLSKGDYIKDVLVASRHLLELIMLRRTKKSAGVDLGLPPKEEVLLFVPLSPLQKVWYEKLIKKTDTAILHELFDSSQNQANPADLTLTSTSSIVQNNVKKPTTWQSLMNLVLQLRKVCNHPYQFEDAEPDPYFSGQHMIEASGKFIVLDKLVTELVVKQKKKIIIFSGFTKMLDLVQELLALRGGDGSIFNTCRIDGGTGRARRNLAIRMFMDFTSNHNVFLISTRAGGLGLNLAAATELILLDQDWNPQITKQAIGRAYRIGLQKPLTVYQFVAQGTVEEQMMPRIAKKLYLSAKVTESMADIYTQDTPSGKEKGNGVSDGEVNDMPEMDTTQLMTLIRRGTSAISRPEIEVSKMLEWDWETTVKMCKDQAADNLARKDVTENSSIDEDEAERQWLAEREQVKSRFFNGQTIEGHRPKSNDSSKDFAPSTSRADRRIGKERTVPMGKYMVSKDTINNGQWEAVKTLSSANPNSISAPKREKKPGINSQTHCQVCKLEGQSPLTSCKNCPRSYHKDCLTPFYQAKATKFQFACPQHACVDCKQKAGDVGGMLYKCRWCEKAQCEDCMDWKKFKPLGDTLVEFDLLGFAKNLNSFYIHCQDCAEKLEKDEEFKALCEELEKKCALRLEKRHTVEEKMNRPGHIKAQSGISNGPRQGTQPTQSTNGSTPATTTHQVGGNHVGVGHGRKETRMGKCSEPPVEQPVSQPPPAKVPYKWTVPSVPQPAPVQIPFSPEMIIANAQGPGRGDYSGNWFNKGGMFTAPRQTAHPTGHMSGTPDMRPAGSERGLNNRQHGYGRFNERPATSPYLAPQSGGQSGGHGNPYDTSRQAAPQESYNIPRRAAQPNSYAPSLYGIHGGGYANMQNTPRQTSQPNPYAPSLYGIHGGSYANMQNTPRQTSQPQAQQYVPPNDAYAGGHGSMANVAGSSTQLQAVTAPVVATPVSQSDGNQTGTGQDKPDMDERTDTSHSSGT